MQEPYLRPRMTIAFALARLHQLIAECSNLPSAGSDPEIRRDRYLMWIENAELQLRDLFESSDIWQALYTERHWRLRDLHATTPRPAPLLSNEAEWQTARLVEIEGRLKQIQQDFNSPDDTILVVPDTNVFLHLQPLPQIPWDKLVDSAKVRLVITLVTIDELDDISNRDKGRSQQAKDALCLLQKLRDDKRPEELVTLRENVTVQVFLDPPGHLRRLNNDDEILLRAQYLSTMNEGKLALASNDYGMKLRAGALRLRIVPIDEKFLRKREPSAKND